MQLERAKQLGLDDLGPDTSPDPGGIVEDHSPWRGADVVEHGAQPVADALARLAAVGLHETHVRERERDDEDVQDLPGPSDDGLGLTEIYLRGAGGPDQFREPLPSLTVLCLPLPHEALNW